MRYNIFVHIRHLAPFMICLLLMGAPLASAGWFGENNYEDCVLANMKGVTSDVAARSIKSACEQKFWVYSKDAFNELRSKYPNLKGWSDCEIAKDLAKGTKTRLGLVLHDYNIDPNSCKF